MPLGPVPEQDYRRTCRAPYGEKGGEVGVGRDEGSILVGRAVEYDDVRRHLDSVLAHMDGIVSSLSESLGDGR